MLRRRALLALNDFKLDALPLAQRLEPFGLNGRVMNEAVRAAVFRRDEPEPLRVVEPLHGTGDASHTGVTPVLKLFPATCAFGLAANRLLARPAPLRARALMESFLLSISVQ